MVADTAAMRVTVEVGRCHEGESVMSASATDTRIRWMQKKETRVIISINCPYGASYSFFGVDHAA